MGTLLPLGNVASELTTMNFVTKKSQQLGARRRTRAGEPTAVVVPAWLRGRRDGLCSTSPSDMEAQHPHQIKHEPQIPA